MSEAERVIEIVGEGRADHGPTARNATVESPDRGVIPVLVHRLCASPSTMRVKRRPIAFSPVTIHEFFSEWGLRVIWSELWWIWLPSAAIVLVGLTLRRQ